MTVERLRLPTPEEALAYKRATETTTCHNLLRQGGQSLELLPNALLRAFEVEAWRERPTPNGSTVANSDFLEWITAPFPRGLEATPEVVEAILTSAQDRGAAERARLLWEQATRRKPGNATGRNQHSANDAGTVDNVNGSSRPTGNSRGRGLLKLADEAEAGNGIAAAALDAVKAGAKTVHRAMVECGFRKSTAIDKDVRDRAAAALAERIVANFPPDELDAAKADAFASGSKALGIALTNLIGQSIMDQRFG